MCPVKSATQMISDLLNRAVSPTINLNAALSLRRKGVTEGEVFYGARGLVREVRLNIVFKMLRSEPGFDSSYLPVSCSQICCSRRREEVDINVH